jgi:hypothetical protein
MNAGGIRKKEPIDIVFPLSAHRARFGHPGADREQDQSVGADRGGLMLNAKDVESLCAVPVGTLQQKRVVSFKFAVTGQHRVALAHAHCNGRHALVGNSLTSLGSSTLGDSKIAA